MKNLTKTEQRELEKLQKEYNVIHERMGYLNNENSIAACNKELDRLNEKMMKILA